MGIPDQTPAGRTEEARERLCGQLIDYSDESVEALAEYRKACIAEAVAPALEYIGERLKACGMGATVPYGDAERKFLTEVKRLLTEGRE